MEQDIFEAGRKLPLMEEFYTLQGEGYHTGSAAYFIRLGGCDIGCRWCDTKRSWNPELHPLVDVSEIIARVLEHKADTVVITGGEPSMYPLHFITKSLKDAGIATHIETSGAYPLTGDWDWICLSPKKTGKPLPDIYTKANELKVIIFEPDDYEWAEWNALKVASNCKLFLQPEWSKHKMIMTELVSYVKLNNKWRVSLQAHKFMRIP